MRTISTVEIDINKPIMQGLKRAIYTTCAINGKCIVSESLWEALRDCWQAGALTWFEFEWLEAYAAAVYDYATHDESGTFQGKVVRCVPSYGTKEEAELLRTMRPLADPENAGFDTPDNDHKYYRPIVELEMLSGFQKMRIEAVTPD